MAKAKKKVFFPTIRLAELAARPGGLLRDDAVDAAARSLESMRAEADGAIRAAIAAMEEIAFDAGRGLDAERISAVLKHADQVVTLAGMFGYAALDTAARSLCDLADGLLRAGLHDRAPIAVHVQTMHLLAPGTMALSAGHTTQMLAELAKVTDHFKFGSLAEAAGQDEFVAAAAP
ncbi:MAG: hypothetical protein WDM86_06470 [Rhizomicrobium sp.]